VGSGEARESDGDRIVFVLSGAIKVESAGGVSHIASRSLAVLRPATCHTLRNDGDAPASFIELLVPPQAVRPDRSHDLIIPLRMSGFREHKSHAAAQGAAFSVHDLANSDTGGIDACLFGTRVPRGTKADRHIHNFDQFYVVLDGALNVEVGVQSFAAPAGSLVVFPAGTVHSTWNEGSESVTALTILAPHPPAGLPRSIAVTLDIPRAYGIS
jgi:quercetin dioxygenase-like cupin family protein